MERIFRGLSIFTLACILLAFAVGLSLRWGDIRDPADNDAHRRASFHRLAGLGAGLAVLLVDSIVVTYFIGTSRWCREVVETYRLDRQFADRGAELKRVAFPWALMNMVMAVTIVALGGTADPSATTRFPQPEPLTWTQLHFLAASLGIGVVGWGLWKQWEHLAANQALIGEIVDVVRQIRVQRGLEPGGAATSAKDATN